MEIYEYEELQGRIEDIKRQFLKGEISETQREFLFIEENNIIKQYENSKAIITNETDINKLIINQEMKGGTA